MTGRNRAIAVAGLSRLGDGLDAVLKLLPPERRDVIARRLEVERGRESGAAPMRLLASRKRELERLERIAAPSAQDCDPRLRRLLIARLVPSHGRD